MGRRERERESDTIKDKGLYTLHYIITLFHWKQLIIKHSVIRAQTTGQKRIQETAALEALRSLSASWLFRGCVGVCSGVCMYECLI